MTSNDIHNSLAHVFLLSIFIAAVPVLWNISTIEGYWMLAISLLTGFYFWWSHIFIGENVHPSENMSDLFFDFILGLLLLSLVAIIPYRNVSGWMVAYLLLFVLALIKYSIILMNTKQSKLRNFMTRSVLTQIGAIVLISLFMELAIALEEVLIALMLLFFMGLIHIIYSAFISKVYKSI